MRKKGFTYNEIVTRLNVPKTTIHYWFKDIVLPESAHTKLAAKKLQHLKNIRLIAANQKKECRMEKLTKIEDLVKGDYHNIKLDKKTKELLLCFLYLGEGFKARNIVGMGNSNPAILRWFIYLLESVYGADRKKMAFYLYLRADQNEITEKEYWSGILGISITQFRKTQFDKRTLGKKTFVGYHGVCAIYLYDTKVEMRLTTLQKYIACMRV